MSLVRVFVFITFSESLIDINSMSMRHDMTQRWNNIKHVTSKSAMQRMLFFPIVTIIIGTNNTHKQNMNMNNFFKQTVLENLNCDLIFAKNLFTSHFYSHRPPKPWLIAAAVQQTILHKNIFDLADFLRIKIKVNSIS